MAATTKLPHKGLRIGRPYSPLRGVPDMRVRELCSRALRFEIAHQRAVGRGARLAEKGHVGALVDGGAPAIMRISCAASTRGQRIRGEPQMSWARTR